MEINYTDINSKTIDSWVDGGWEWGKAISHEEFLQAKKGYPGVLLTPTKKVPLEWFGSFEGKKMCYIGDGNNMANSLIVGGIKMGMKVSVACPEGYEPDKEIMEWAKANGEFVCTDNILEAAKDSDVIFTDVWASMGQENEMNERKKIFAGYQINDEVMSVAKPDAMVQHCLPAHREEEITAKVFEEHAKEIFAEAENRLHAQKAVLVKLLG